MTLVSVALLLLSALALATQALVLEGQFSTLDHWVYVGKFGFADTGRGKLEFFDTAPNRIGNRDYGDPVLLLYLDKPNQKDYFLDVWKERHALNCSDLVKIAHRRSVTAVRKGAKNEISLNDVRRSHFWFAVVANCKLPPGVPFEMAYHAHFKNEFVSEIFSEVSAEDQGLVILFPMFAAIFLVGIVLQTFAGVVLWQSSSLHPIACLLNTALVLEFLFLTLNAVHWLVFIHDGRGLAPLVVAADFLDAGGVVLLMLLLVVLAKGYAVSFVELRGPYVTIVAMVVCAAVYVCMLTWKYLALDPVLDVYVYRTWVGWVLLAVRLCVLAYFIIELLVTLSVERQGPKRVLYYTLGVFFGLWFLSLPATVVLSSLIQPWTLEVAVLAIYCASNTVAFLVLGFLMWPSNANTYFQLHPPDVFETDLLDYDNL
eukprot:CAMPEP_0177655492 /NCGR_PEP_ID=MMETSP0447-20121125/15001_1 /TAXON_ID=0 /ORGANISM="Stygamoeba regulata, Strain BSH-02190019" /LENGTH=427 /DNA_ID=CAMNT_0019159425 /DNA_START=35 /DNA_END=1318 /DNA_ORIENTATION=+